MQAIGMPLWFWILVAIGALGILAAVAGYLLWRSSGHYDAAREMIGVGTAGTGMAAVVISGVVLAISLFPYNPDYWPMYRVEGAVTSVSNVLTEDGGDLTRTPVVTLDSFDQPLTVEDPRAVNLDGKEVTLRCDRQWVYQAADRYSCAIQSAR